MQASIEYTNESHFQGQVIPFSSITPAFSSKDDLGEKRQIKARKKKVQKVSNCKGHTRKRLTVDDWCKRYLKRIAPLRSDQRHSLELYMPAIRKGIEFATSWDGLDRLENFEKLRECFEYELLIKSVDHLLAKRYPKRAVTKWAKKLTSKRKYSWFDVLIRQREAIRIHAQPFILERDDEGEIVDVGQPEPESSPQLNLPNPYWSNPEEFLLDMETFQNIQQLPSKVGSLPKKRAKEYQWILESILDGKKLSSKAAEMHGIPAKNLTSIIHQAKKEARAQVAEDDEELAKQYSISKEQKRKKHTIKKSTFKDRKPLYRKAYSEEMEPRLIRHLRKIDGGKSPRKGHSAPNTFKETASVRKEAA